MYYISNQIQEVESYNNHIASLEMYPSHWKWADVITHKDGNQFAILKHNNYPSEMQEIESLEGWFENQEI